ncbi:MAG: DUF2804 domain-containing protein [Treponema sp.]|nr:DUF2804 domain-containing protein [Treponema sp.]
MPEIEITGPLPVLDDLGRPQNFGWARSPLWEYDSAYLRAPRRSICEGDRYILFSPTHLVMMELLDDGYLGYMCVSVVSLKDWKRSTQSYITPFPLGCFDLPSSSESGSIKYFRKKNLLNFAVMEEGVRIIMLDIPRFGSLRTLRGKVVLTPPEGADSLVTHMPWRGRGDAFCFSRRSPHYTAEGVIQHGSGEIIFTKGNGWGIFDWHRGIRPRTDLRFWASGCGQWEGQQLGFSVGYSSADSSQGTENAFFLDGKLHKLDQVSFHIPSDKDVPWRFTSNDMRLEMFFTPLQERDENRQMFFYSLKRRQLFGSFHGRVVLDDGRVINFQDITGMAERRKSRL